MTGLQIAASIGFAIFAYFIGSISWATIFSKCFKKEDIRTKGSGNAGATNTLRNYGVKAGLLVFALDVLKPIITIWIAFAINKVIVDQDRHIYLPFIGMATILGHIFPIYFKFKGGKGAACLLGFIIALNWIIAIIGFFVFMTIVLTTKKVSLGSIIAPMLLLIIYIGFGAGDILRESWAMPFMNDIAWWGPAIIFGLAWLIVVWKHKANIKRLLNGTENSIGRKKEA